MPQRSSEDAGRGRVVRVDRGAADVSVGSTLLRVGDPSGRLLVGDWVTLSSEQDVAEVLPRTSVVSRGSASRTSDEQPLAANVDVVVVVEPAGPDLSVGRVERLLVLAWSSGATPLVALTKTDLVHPRVLLDDVVERVRTVAVGVDVVCLSAHQGEGLDELRAHVGDGRTFVLLGPSGAGKSTLTNALAGASMLTTADVRSDGRGRHTTTHRQLVELVDGSAVIDTPGLRAVSLVGDVDAVDSTFRDVLDLAAGCRFRDCSHDHEPGCAVRVALDDGRLAERRLESWRKLGREAAFQARRGDARLEREERARVRARTKAWRRTPNRPSR